MIMIIITMIIMMSRIIFWGSKVITLHYSPLVMMVVVVVDSIMVISMKTMVTVRVILGVMMLIIICTCFSYMLESRSTSNSGKYSFFRNATHICCSELPPISFVHKCHLYKVAKFHGFCVSGGKCSRQKHLLWE